MLIYVFPLYLYLQTINDKSHLIVAYFVPFMTIIIHYIVIVTNSLLIS